ncbi:MAG: hypothetical protein N3F63_03885 [Thermoplasmata archaeon]|nr:hypothetical protein [Thermoplasmata archaeon]
MWLITTTVCAMAATAAYFVLEKQRKAGKKYKVHYLSLMLWGAAMMILVDHAIGYIEEGGSFIEVETDGLVTNGAVLGLLMLLPVLGVWLGSIGIEKMLEKKEQR